LAVSNTFYASGPRSRSCSRRTLVGNGPPPFMGMGPRCRGVFSGPWALGPQPDRAGPGRGVGPSLLSGGVSTADRGGRLRGPPLATSGCRAPPALSSKQRTEACAVGASWRRRRRVTAACCAGASALALLRAVLACFALLARTGRGPATPQRPAAGRRPVAGPRAPRCRTPRTALQDPAHRVAGPRAPRGSTPRTPWQGPAHRVAGLRAPRGSCHPADAGCDPAGGPPSAVGDAGPQGRLRRGAGAIAGDRASDRPHLAGCGQQSSGLPAGGPQSAVTAVGGADPQAT
jgi:hypothetical protein